MDATTLLLAVDSTQVNSAAAALDRMAVSGTKAETTAELLTKASLDQGKALRTGVADGAKKAQTSIADLARTSTTLGTSSFSGLDKANASLGETSALAAQATRQVDALGDALAQTGGVRPVAAPTAPARTAPAGQATPAAGPLPPAAAVSTFGQAANAAAAGAQRLQEAEQALALASARSEAAQAALTAATQRNAAAQQNLAVVLGSGLASQAQVAQAQQSAATAQAAMLGAQARATASTQAAAKASEDHRKALASMGRQNVLTANQAQQLGFQMHDFFVQVASGQSALTAAIQQGSQLSGTFGGIKNAASAVLSLLTPLRVGLLGIGAGVGVFALLASHAEDAARSIGSVQAALAATGRGGSISDSGLADIVEQLSRLPGVSRDAAEQTVAEFARIKGVSADLFLGLGSLAADYARVTGKDVPAAARELGKAFADPEQGAKTLEDALGSLSSSALLTIQRLSDQGDRLGAQRVLYDELKRTIGGLASEGLTPLQEATKELSNAWDKLTGSFRESDGLRNAVSEVARLVGYMKDAVEWFDRADKAWRNGPGRFMPGARPAFTGGASASFDSPGGATGSFGQPAAPLGTAPTQAVGAVTQAVEEQTKAALKLAGAYQTTAGQIDKLLARRKQLADALAINKGTPGREAQVKDLTAGIAGIDESVAALRKRAQGRPDKEPEQTRRVALEADLSGFQDVLQKERDALAFHSRFLQGEYQAGTVSLREFYADRRQTIADGVAAEITELQQEKDRLAKDRDAIAQKDPSEARRLQGRIDDATREQERARTRAANDLTLTNQEETASFKALSDQVVNYKANLLQLQGDEIGAAKLRAQQAIQQASVLARQAAPVSSGSFARQDRGQGDESEVDVRKLERITFENIDIQKARQTTNRVTEQLQIEEERIALKLQKGSITEYEALRQVGTARSEVISKLEKQVAIQEEIAKTRPEDVEFQLSTERARLELDKLKASLDPLAEKFDNLFRDSGASAIEDLLNQTKSLKGAAEGFLNSIVQQVNKDTARAASDALFGKGGIFGGAGAAFGGLFGGKRQVNGIDDGFAGSFGIDAKKGSVEVGPLEAKTAAVSQSLATLQTAGIDPTTSALTRLQQAADAAAVALARPGTPGVAGITPIPAAGAAVVLPSTGDLARADRVSETSTTETTESAQALSTTLVDTRTSTQQFAAVLQPAAGLVAGLGQAGSVAGYALALLPSIVQAFAASTASSSASSSGGSFLSSLFGSGGSKPTSGDFARMDRGQTGEGGGFFASAASYFSSFFHTGGVVGDKKDMRAVNPGVFEGAGKYHSGGIVGGEALASLKANEVPAILLGGPKGVREEVLTAADPRHKDNLSPILLKTIQDAQGNPASVLSILASGGKGGDGGVGGSGGIGGDGAVAGMLKREQATRELSPLTKFLIGSPETVKGLVSELSREADFESVSALRDITRVSGARELGGPVSPNSLYRVNERKPELLEVAGKQYLMTGSKGGEVKQQDKQGRPINVTVNQHFSPETNRQTIGQAAVQTGAVVRRELARGTA